MAISLAEAKLNSTDDMDVMVIDEFRKESVLMDALVFDDVVNPAGGGDTLTYGYRRLITQPIAATRAINSEYTPQNVTTQRYTVDLAVLGGSFEVDRVVAKIGPAASASVALNMSQKIKATATHFQDLVINGDTGVDANAFDGLDVALTGSDTEFNAGSVTDWTDLDTDAARKHTALDELDEFLMTLDGDPTLLLGNQYALAKVRAIVRRSGMYTRDPIEGLVGQGGRPVMRETYGGLTFVDVGNKAGTNAPIIPLRDPDNSVWTITHSAGTDGGTFAIRVEVDGEVDTTADLAWNVSTANLDTALEGLSNVPASSVTVATTGGAGVDYTITFAGDLAGESVHLEIVDDVLTDGGVLEPTTLAQSASKGGLTDLYAVRIGMDGFHGVSTVGGQVVQTYLPDFTTAGAVKKGEVEMGPVAVALKATKAAAVFRNIRVR
jgi:hypothetical protein